MSATSLSALRAYSVVYVGDIAYYLRNRVEVCCNNSMLVCSNQLQCLLPTIFATNDSLQPVTVIQFGDQPLTVDSIEKNLARFEASDDVFHPNFLDRGILFVQRPSTGEPSTTIPESVREFLEKHSSKLYFSDPRNVRLPEGPYFLSGQNLHQAWRLYADHSRAFVTAVAPDDFSGSHLYEFPESY